MTHTRPLRLQPAESQVYSHEYWGAVDCAVLAAKVRRPHHVYIPPHFELGLNGTHRIEPAPRASWWRTWWLERSPWMDLAFFAIVIGALVLAIFWAGGRLEVGP